MLRLVKYLNMKFETVEILQEKYTNTCLTLWHASFFLSIDRVMDFTTAPDNKTKR